MAQNILISGLGAVTPLCYRVNTSITFVDNLYSFKHCCTYLHDVAYRLQDDHNDLGILHTQQVNKGLENTSLNSKHHLLYVATAC